MARQVTCMLLLLIVVVLTTATPSSSVIDVLETFRNVSQTSIALAIKHAREQLTKGGNVTVSFPPGTFNINTTEPPFEISGVNPRSNAWLTFQGAGMAKTILRFDGRKDIISGRNMHRVAFSDLTFACQKLTTSQGVVVSTSADSVTINVQDGYPGVAELMVDPKKFGGKFLRRYRQANDGSCQLITDKFNGTRWPPTENRQVFGKNATKSMRSSRRWTLSGVSRPSAFTKGDIVGVQSKHGGQTYVLHNGDGISFLRVRWTEQSRGVLREVSNIRFEDCRVSKSSLAPKSGLGPCLASPGGGPQLGHPTDSRIRNVVVKNHISEGTGDDAIAFFNVDNGELSGSRISDSFARGILLYSSSAVRLSGNILHRCPVFRVESSLG